MWKHEIKIIIIIMPQQLRTGNTFCGLLKLKHIMNFCVKMKEKKLIPFENIDMVGSYLLFNLSTLQRVVTLQTHFHSMSFLSNIP